MYYLFDGKDIFLRPEMLKCVPLLCFMWLYNFLDFITKVALHYYEITTNIEKTPQPPLSYPICYDLKI